MVACSRSFRMTACNDSDQHAAGEAKKSSAWNRVYTVHPYRRARRERPPAIPVSWSAGDGPILGSRHLRTERLLRKAGIEEHMYLNIAATGGRCGVGCRFSTDLPEHTLTLHTHRGGEDAVQDSSGLLYEESGTEGCAGISSQARSHTGFRPRAAQRPCCPRRRATDHCSRYDQDYVAACRRSPLPERQDCRGNDRDG